jgi:hypothetical protein
MSCLQFSKQRHTGGWMKIKMVVSDSHYATPLSNYTCLAIILIFVEALTKTGASVWPGCNTMMTKRECSGV